MQLSEDCCGDQMRSLIGSTNGHQAPTLCICRCQGCCNKMLVCEHREGCAQCRKKCTRSFQREHQPAMCLGVREALSEQVTSELRRKGWRFIVIPDKHMTRQLLHSHCTGEAHVLDLSEHLPCRTVAHRAFGGPGS